MGRQGKSRSDHRLHHQSGRQAHTDRYRRVASEIRPRHSADVGLVRGRSCRQSQAGRRAGDLADQRARRRAARFGICRQTEGKMDRRADRRPDHGPDPLRPHRLLQAICRARRDADVPGRRAAGPVARRRLDLGRLFGRGRKVRQGWLSVWHAAQHLERFGQLGQRRVRCAGSATRRTRKATSRSNRMPSKRSWRGSKKLCRFSRRACLPGTMPATTNGWFRARAL